MLKKRKINKNKLMGILTFLLLVISGICFFLKSDFFNLDEIIIKDNKHLSKGEIEKMMSINLNRNIFSYNLEEIKERINKSLYVESCEVKREMPNKVIVEITEKKIIGPIFNNEDYIYVDNEGDLIEVRDKVDKNKMIINMEYSIKGNNVEIEKNNKESLIMLVKCLEDENMLKKVKEVNMNSKNKISMRIEKGLDIDIKKDNNISRNIKKLQEILVDLQNRKEYYGKIDMTYDNYILYKQ